MVDGDDLGQWSLEAEVRFHRTGDALLRDASLTPALSRSTDVQSWCRHRRSRKPHCQCCPCSAFSFSRSYSVPPPLQQLIFNHGWRPRSQTMSTHTVRSTRPPDTQTISVGALYQQASTAPLIHLDQNELYLPSDIESQLKHTIPALNNTPIPSQPRPLLSPSPT